MFNLPRCLFLLTASAQVQVEPVGRWFEAYIRRRNRNVSSSFQELEEEEESSEESADEEFQLEEYSMLRKLDPKDWKVCDISAVCKEIPAFTSALNGFLCLRRQKI